MRESLLSPIVLPVPEVSVHLSLMYSVAPTYCNLNFLVCHDLVAMSNKRILCPLESSMYIAGHGACTYTCSQVLIGIVQCIKPMAYMHDAIVNC